MSTKNSKQEYYDGYANPEIIKELRKGKVTHSQCKFCLNKIGTHACKKFGERPDQYSNPLAKVQCPEMKVK